MKQYRAHQPILQKISLLTMKVPEKREEITLAWLNSIFKQHGIVVHGFQFDGEIGNGRGFMGTLEQVKLEITRVPNFSSTSVTCNANAVSTENQVDHPIETLHIILKTLPNDPFRKSYAANDGFSSREVSMYTEIFKAWDEFLDSRQVPPANRFRYPVCYYGAEEGHRDTYKYILVLENLIAPKSDFHLWTGGFTEALPWHAASAVIRQIARFHATGIAYKIENKVESYTKRFPKLNHVVSSAFQMMWDNGFQITKEVIEATVDPQDIPNGIFEQLDKLRSDEGRELLLKWFTCSDSVFSGNKATVCHHDLHSNNLVLSGDKSMAILFDYQASCAFNPMKDLSFFLILNCHSEDAITKLPRALEVYHDEFEKTMKAINTDFEYSFESMQKDYDWYLTFSLTHVMTGGPIWITGPQSTIESKRRFALAVIDAFKRGVLKYPTHELPSS